MTFTELVGDLWLQDLTKMHMSSLRETGLPALKRTLQELVQEIQYLCSHCCLILLLHEEHPCRCYLRRAAQCIGSVRNCWAPRGMLTHPAKREAAAAETCDSALSLLDCSYHDECIHGSLLA